MGLATSAIHFISYLLEGRINSSFAVMALTLILVIVVISVATLNYRKALDGYISYWNAFGYGVAIFLFAGIVGAAYSYVFNNFDPDYVYRQLELSRQQLLNTELLTETAIDKAISDLKEGLDYQMQHPFQSALSATFWNTFLGALFCLISSAFLRKPKSEIINES
jgi:uncharacterized membrane protein YwaF